MSAKALAREAGLALPTTYHLLRTLVHEGYLAREDGGYVLGHRVGGLGRHGDLPTWRTRPALTELMGELSGATYLAVYRDGEIELGRRGRQCRLPAHRPLGGPPGSGHATALGKAILTVLPEDLREDYLARHELADLTP